MLAGSLFSGIGNAELGLHWAGIDTAWSVEAEPYRRRVLKQWWPDTRVYSDVRFVDIEYDLGRVDLIVGGFPCQDTSNAGLKRGLDGKHSGLFSYFIDIVRTLQPRYVVVENVTGLRSAGMGRVVGELAALGYVGEWESIPAHTLGAPHRRDRVWIVAHLPAQTASINAVSLQQQRALADPGAYSHRRAGQYRQLPYPPWASADLDSIVDRSPLSSLAVRQPDLVRNPTEIFDGHALAAYKALCARAWATEPTVGRVVDGATTGLDPAIRMTRLRALGDSLIPHIVSFIALRIQLQLAVL